MLYSIIGILVIILDQLVKYFVDQNINWTKPVIELIPNVLSLVRVQNDGAAFSFLSGGSARIWFIALTAVFAILVVIALATNFVSGRFGRWCLVFITAGGLSNMIDRIRFGYVIDMFRIDMFDFAVFNVADIFITVFCIAFILYILFGGEKEREEEDEFDEDEDEYEEELPPRRVKRARKASDDRYEDEPEEIKPRRARRKAAEEEEEVEEAPVRTRARKEQATAVRRNADAAYAQSGSARRERPAAERRRPDTADTADSRSVKKAAAPQTRTRTAAEPNDDRIFEEMFGGNQPAEKPVQPQRTAAPQVRQSTVKNTKTEDPFADWEKANARASAANRAAYSRAADTVDRVKAAAAEPDDAFSEFLNSSAPAKTVQKAEKAAAPKTRITPPASKADDEFDLDSILNEFK